MSLPLLPDCRHGQMAIWHTGARTRPTLNNTCHTISIAVSSATAVTLLHMKTEKNTYDEWTSERPNHYSTLCEAISRNSCTFHYNYIFLSSVFSAVKKFSHSKWCLFALMKRNDSSRLTQWPTML